MRATFAIAHLAAASAFGACGQYGEAAAPAPADAGPDVVAVPEAAAPVDAGDANVDAGDAFAFDDVAALEANDSHAFVADRAGIARCTRMGCERVSVPDPLVASRVLALGPDGFVYTASGLGLYRCGGTPFACTMDLRDETLSTRPPSALVVRAAAIYWTTVGENVLHVLARDTKTKNDQPLMRASAPLARSNAGVLVGDSSAVLEYDEAKGELHSVALVAQARAVREGSMRRGFVTAEGYVATTTPLDPAVSRLMNAAPASSIALGPTKTYWTQPTTGDVMSAPYDAGADISPIVTRLANPRFVALGGDTLYVVTTHISDGSGPAVLGFATP